MSGTQRSIALNRPTDELSHLSDGDLVSRCLSSEPHGIDGEQLVARAPVWTWSTLDLDEVFADVLSTMQRRRLAAIQELAHRVGDDGEALGSPDTISVLVRDLALRSREHFVAVLLDARHRLLGRFTVSVGSVSATLVHPREVFREAVARGASALIVVHNHPSGDPSPSRDDVAMTRRLMDAGTVMGIPVLDHVIVTRGGYCSLREDGYV